jgi:signal transduction histidine kinase
MHARVRRADVLLALLLTAVGLAEARLGLTGAREPWYIVATVPLVCGPVACRHRYALPALLVVLATQSVQSLAGSELAGGLAEGVALVVVLYSVGSTLTLRTGLIGLVTALAASAAVVTMTGGAHAGNYVYVTTVVLAAWSAGQGVRLAHERSALLAEHRAVQERGRIARELHDVVSHHVSGIVVQAGAERRGLDPGSPVARTLEDIETAGRQTLTELRRLLGVLRVDDTAPLRPQPGLADLPELVESARAAGVRATLELRGDRVPLDDGIELAAYRVVQESLTNVAKHASSGTARVVVHWSGAGLEVEVTDDGGAPAGQVPGTGYGLVAMAERLRAHGGVVEAGPTASGFRVHAVLPAGGSA